MPQQPKRFQAPTLDEAYDQVRDALGDEAVILATRRATSPSLYGRPARSFVEVLAHIPEGPIPAGQSVSGFDFGLEHGGDGNLAAPFVDPLAGSGSIDPELLARVREARRIRGTADEEALRALDRSVESGGLADGAQPLAVEPGAEPAGTVFEGESESEVEQAADELMEAAAAHLEQRTELGELLHEVGEMRGMVEQLSQARVNELVDHGPVPLKRLRAQLRLQGVTNRLAMTVLDDAAGGLSRGGGGGSRAEELEESAARRTVERKLAGLLVKRPQLDLLKRPVVIPLVGPAGAGKTTLAMRLALDLMHSYSLRVVVAGTDVERAGAPQQLTALGAAAGVATRLCYTPGELQALVSEPGVDAVVVDTPGHDGTRRDRMAELQAFIHAARQREVLLVLPATMKTLDLEAVARAYAAVKPSGVVLTRCDATSTFGEPFSALVGAGLGLAFTTHDEAVTSAPRAGDNLALSRAILDGRWPTVSATTGAERRPDPGAAPSVSRRAA